MGKFNEYSQKATPEDADSLMIYDAAAKANKLSPFSGIWNWIVEKLTNAVISNLQTSNQTVLGAINELNNGLPAGGIYDLDNPPKKMIFSAMAGSTNLPNDFGGANAVTVIQMNLGGGNFDAMIAFTFAVDKIAIRRKNGTENWSEWKYFNTSEILSNLTTTNKSSLVGAINELNSNRAFGTLIASEGHDCNNLGFGIFVLLNPKNGVTEINWHVVISANNNRAQTGFQITYDLTDGSKAYTRTQAAGIWSDWVFIK